MGSLRTWWLPALTMLLVASTACSIHLNRRPPAKLRVVAEPPEARVYVDEEFAGRAQALDVRPKTLSEGEHRVTVEAPGHFPHDLEVQLVPGVTTVRVSLRPVPE